MLGSTRTVTAHSKVAGKMASLLRPPRGNATKRHLHPQPGSDKSPGTCAFGGLHMEPLPAAGTFLTHAADFPHHRKRSGSRTRKDWTENGARGTLHELRCVHDRHSQQILLDPYRGETKYPKETRPHQLFKQHSDPRLASELSTQPSSP